MTGAHPATTDTTLARVPMQELTGRFLLAMAIAMVVSAALLFFGIDVYPDPGPWDPAMVRRLAVANASVGVIAGVVAALQRGFGARPGWQNRGFEPTLMGAAILGTAPWLYAVYIAGTVTTTFVVGPMFLLCVMIWSLPWRRVVAFASLHLVGLVILSVLEATGHLPYAPVLADPAATFDVFARRGYPAIAIASTLAMWGVAMVALRGARRVVHDSHERLERLVEERAAELQASHAKLIEQIETEDRIRRSSEELEIELDLRRVELERVGRTAALGELSATIAHELDGPLAQMIDRLEAALRSVDDGAVDAAGLNAEVAEIAATNRRASETIKRIRALFSPASVASSEVDLPAVVDRVLELLAEQFRRASVQVVVHPPADGEARLRGDETLLQQAVFNLLSNAYHRVSRLGRTADRVIELSMVRVADAVHLDVYDPVPIDIDLDDLPVTLGGSRRRRLAVGLGLAQHVADAHDGQLERVSDESGRPIVRLSIPQGDVG